MKIYKYISCLFLIILPFAASCSEYDDSLRVNEWQILYEDADSPAEAASKNAWNSIDVPSMFKVPEPAEKYFKFIWLRGNFTIYDDPSHYQGISTGRIRYSDTVYINGRCVGTTSHKKVNWGPSPRNYKIPEGTLKRGVNLVYLRLGVYDKYFAGILGDVYVQPEDEFDREQFLSNFIYKQLPLGIVVLFAGIAVSLLTTYLWDRREKIYLISSFPLLVGILYIFFPYFSYRLMSYELYLAIQYALTPIFAVIFLILFQSIYRIYLSHYNRIIIAVMSLCIILILLFRDEKYNEQLGVAVIILSVLMLVPVFILMIRRLYTVNPDRMLLSLVCLMFVIALFIIVTETYLGITGGISSQLIATFTPLSFIILGTAVTTREIKKRKKELELLYDKLTKLEGKEISITDTLEEKLKRVIKFIDENYKSDLSREGLASAVGIHPNYFGRLFKTYTGKTINEYINGLRIEDAINQLKMEEVKIIDIAFNVGYESLVTFNRVFKKVTGKTPSEYRDEM